MVLCRIKFVPRVRLPILNSYTIWIPFHSYFSPAVSSLNNVCQLISRTTNCRLYSNISHILLLYRIWVHYNKFDLMKSLGLDYWYIKMTRCNCEEHGLEYITFYVQIHVAHIAACPEPPLVHDGPLEAPAFVKLVVNVLLSTRPGAPFLHKEWLKYQNE